jgi:hypothetical protein
MYHLSTTSSSTTRLSSPMMIAMIIEEDSELLSGFPFIGYGNPDSNLEATCITEVTEDAL